MVLRQPQDATAASEPGPFFEEHPNSGASPSPPAPREALATVGPLRADAAAEPDSPSGMESLPDELLELILSLVPTTRPYSMAGLMRLRRVSRQWARVLCSAAVWRHHTLEVYSSHHRALLDPCIPVVDTVSVGLDEHGADPEAALQALATTHWKVRCLTLTTTVTTTVARWLPRILQQHSHRLQELRVSLSEKARLKFFSVNPILAVVTAMPELRAVSLNASRARHCCIEYDSQQLLALRYLHVDGYGVGPFEMASLLRAHKDTLLEVDCGRHDVFDLLPQCPLLRKVTTSAMESPASRYLDEVRGLRLLSVTALDRGRVGLRSLVSLLEGSPAVPAELHLTVDGFASQLTLLHAAVGLGGRLRSLRLADYCVPLLERHLAAALGNLPRLELLVFAKIQPTDWDRVEAAWTERTAPALRELHVHWRGPCESRNMEWVPRMQAARPALRICTSNDCPERQR